MARTGSRLGTIGDRFGSATFIPSRQGILTRWRGTHPRSLRIGSYLAFCLT